jgi:hypothetical protein
MQQRHIRAAGAVAAGAALFIGMGTGAVGSLPSDGEPELPLTISPVQGPPGTEISVSGEQCTETDVTLRLSLGEETLDEQVVEVEDPYDPDPGHGDHGGGLDILRYAGGESEEPGTGAFAGVVTVPVEDRLIRQTLEVSATCNPVYEVQSFVVIEPTTTPPPTDPPGNGGNGGGGNGGNGGAGGGEGTPGTTAPAPAPAPRAAPVSGAPSYTG